jgi:hypothetical protein
MKIKGVSSEKDKLPSRHLCAAVQHAAKPKQ